MERLYQLEHEGKKEKKRWVCLLNMRAKEVDQKGNAQTKKRDNP